MLCNARIELSSIAQFPLADPGRGSGCGGGCLRGTRSFQEKFSQIIGWGPPFGVGTPVWEILDPPLISEIQYQECKLVQNIS